MWRAISSDFIRIKPCLLLILSTSCLVNKDSQRKFSARHARRQAHWIETGDDNSSIKPAKIIRLSVGDQSPMSKQCGLERRNTISRATTGGVRHEWVVHPADVSSNHRARDLSRLVWGPDADMKSPSSVATVNSRLLFPCRAIAKTRTTARTSDRVERRGCGLR